MPKAEMNDATDAAPIKSDLTTISDVNVVDELHDLLNRFSGLYSRDSNENVVVQPTDIATQTVARAAELLNLSNEDATLFLIGHCDHKIEESNGTRTLTYDATKLAD